MSLWKKIKNYINDLPLEPPDVIPLEVDTTPTVRIEKPKKPRKPKPKVTKTPKQIATAKKEPYISVLSVELDKNNPGNGNFELDWNEYFIKELRAAGYPGKTDEDVVDMWFRSVCRNVLAETFEQEVAQKDNVRYINRKIGDDGRTEVS